MALFAKTLWPETVRAPYLRLATAMIVVPMIMAVFLAALAFLVGGLSKPDRDAVIADVMGILPYLIGGLLAFTLTFGLAGIAALWALRQRGLVVWALAGAVAGTAAGGVLMLSGSFSAVWPVLVGTGLLGWMTFIMIRGIAGIRAERPPSRV